VSIYFQKANGKPGLGTFLLKRGAYDAPGDKVSPNVPAALPPMPKDAPPNRLGLAMWLTDPSHPLTSRVAVNRFWYQYFGVGLVKTMEDWGVQGEPPSHPELLDWLAKDFEKSGYNVKRFVRAVVLSQSYGLTHGDAMPTTFSAALERPLTAEQLGRSWRIAAGAEKDDEALRRAVVNAIPDVLPKEYNATFQQAQFLANSPALLAMLKPAAERLAAVEGDSERVRQAFLSVLGRAPDTEELAAVKAFLKERATDPTGAARDLLWALMTSAEFLTMP